LDPKVLERRVLLDRVFKAFHTRVSGGNARVNGHHHDLAAVRVELLDGIESGLSTTLIVRSDR
jgi:hypothetical protein